jgi:hypothetical protein
MKRTATILLALLAMAGLAQALTVSAAVGPLIKDAQQMIAARNYKGATDKLNQAEAVKSNPDDETVINQMRQVIAAASLDPTQPKCTSAAMGITRCDGRRAVGGQP